MQRLSQADELFKLEVNGGSAAKERCLQMVRYAIGTKQACGTKSGGVWGFRCSGSLGGTASRNSSDLRKSGATVGDFLNNNSFLTICLPSPLHPFNLRNSWQLRLLRAHECKCSRPWLWHKVSKHLALRTACQINLLAVMSCRQGRKECITLTRDEL